MTLSVSCTMSQWRCCGLPSNNRTIQTGCFGVRLMQPSVISWFCTRINSISPPRMTKPSPPIKFKEIFENHPIPWGIGLLASGFVAGITVHQYFQGSSTGASCSIEGISALEQTHSRNLEILNQKLVGLEDDATNPILYNRELKLAAASRIRKDIERLSQSHQVAISLLRKRCG